MFYRFPTIRLASLCVAILALAASALSAADVPVEINQVRYQRVKNDWLQMSVAFSVQGLRSPQTPDGKFVDDVEMVVYLAFLLDRDTRKYALFHTTVQIPTIEEGRYETAFYIPGPVARRYELQSAREPTFYLIDVKVGGRLQVPADEAFNSNDPALSAENYALLRDFGEKNKEEFKGLLLHSSQMPGLGGNLNNDSAPFFMAPYVLEEVE